MLMSNRRAMDRGEQRVWQFSAPSAWQLCQLSRAQKKQALETRPKYRLYNPVLQHGTSWRLQEGDATIAPLQAFSGGSGGTGANPHRAGLGLDAGAAPIVNLERTGLQAPVVGVACFYQLSVVCGGYMKWKTWY